MDVRWSKGCDIPTSESSHVQPLISYEKYRFILSRLNQDNVVSRQLYVELVMNGNIHYHMYQLGTRTIVVQWSLIGNTDVHVHNWSKIPV